MKQRWVGAILIVAVLIGGARFIPFPEAAATLSDPLGQKLYSLGQSLRSGIKELAHLGSLAATNKALEQDKLELQQQLSDYKQIQEENRQLRDQVGLLEDSGLDYQVAEVTGFQPDGLRRFLRVNLGSQQGITPGMAVAYGNYLVGVVREVSSHTATILLRDDPEFRVLVVSQDSQANGILIGLSGSSQMEKIPQNQIIGQGQLIVTSGLEGNFPKGLVIGEVTSVAQDKDSIFQTAQISEPIDLMNLRVVSLISGS